MSFIIYSTMYNDIYRIILFGAIAPQKKYMSMMSLRFYVQRDMPVVNAYTGYR